MTSRPPDRRERILDAAADLFAARGFAAVSMDDIGAAVGVSGPAVYHHFKGKGAVLDAVVTRVAKRTVASMAAAPDLASTPPDEFGRHFVGLVLDDRSGYATLQRERRHVGLAAGEALAAMDAAVARYQQAVIRQVSPEADDLAVAVRQAALVGLVFDLSVRPIEVRRPRLDELLLSAGLAVLGAPPQPRPPAAERPTTWRPPTTRRHDILAAARRLFRTRGYYGVAVDDIGEEAGLSGPSVYRFYRNKADVFFDACDRVTASVMLGAEEAQAGATSPGDAVERLARSMAEVALANVGLVRLAWVERDALGPAERFLLDRRRDTVVEAWSAVLQEARPGLGLPESRFLCSTGLTMVEHAVEPTGGGSEWASEIAALLVAYMYA